MISILLSTPSLQSLLLSYLLADNTIWCPFNFEIIPCRAYSYRVYPRIRRSYIHFSFESFLTQPIFAMFAHEQNKRNNVNTQCILLSNPSFRRRAYLTHEQNSIAIHLISNFSLQGWWSRCNSRHFILQSFLTEPIPAVFTHEQNRHNNAQFITMTS